MTLIVTVNGPESIWVLADRRLFYKGRPPKDDARKIMFLDTTDAQSILGYAGLGATALGTEPSDWMSAVLRCRKLPLERSLGVLAEAMKKQLPQHMIQMPRVGGPAHTVIVTAFLADEPRLYTIDLKFAPDGKSYHFGYTRRVFCKPTPATPGTPRFAIGGSGASYLCKDKEWMRNLLRVVRANDRGQVSPHAVADQLARLNHEVHLAVADKSVGPRCIVAWRHRKGSVHNGGGAHQFYTGTTRDASSFALSKIANGFDVRAIVELTARRDWGLSATLKGHLANKLDDDEFKAELARLPDTPDEKLR